MAEDYGLKDLTPDEIYNLLPYVVRATDPSGAIKALFNGLEELHNDAIEKLRALPRLQDPDQCGKFTPTQFGEDEDSYARYLELVYISDQRELTTSEDVEKDYLASQLPQSLDAREKELSYLAMLADTIGCTVLNKFFTKIIRLWIRTGILRNHINGTHSAVFLLGKALGFVDLKVSELWSRFTIKDPTDLKSNKNDVDFATVPEIYPYYPENRPYGDARDVERDAERRDGIDGSYTKTETLQTPYGEISYSPEILDDADLPYTVVYYNVSENVSSRFHYNLLINGHNPFGNFTTLVQHQLVNSAFTLSNGSDSQKAYVTIMSKNGSTAYRFEAITYGAWANGVSITISDNNDSISPCDPEINYAHFEGKQRVQLSGPQSKIKFKSSYFDLLTSIDPVSFLHSFPAIPVTTNNNLEEIGGYTYEVDAGNNLITFSFASEPSLSEGDSIVVVNSTSQLDRDGFEVDRNQRYVVDTVSGTNAVSHLSEVNNCTFDVSTSGYDSIEFVEVVNSSGSALFYFEHTIQMLEEGDNVFITGSSSYNNSNLSIAHVNSSSNTLSFDTPFVGNDRGFIVYQVEGGYPDGIIPYGVDSPDTNGSIFKLLDPSVEDGQSYSIKGNTRGFREEADPEGDFEINLKVYFELISVVRALFEEMRPASKTIRKEFDGFLLRDNVNYAPLKIISTVILQSPSGSLYEMGVTLDGASRSVSWSLVTGVAATTIIQRDRLNSRYYQWGISDAGVFTTTLTGVQQSSLVYYKSDSDSTQSCYVYLEANSLETSVYAPEFALEDIHLVDGSEDYIADDVANVVESCTEAIRAWMPAEAFSTDAPSAQFAFQQGPEDKLDMKDIFMDFSYGHLTIPWLQDAKFIWVDGAIIPVVGETNQFGFSEGLSQHYFNTDSGSSWHGGEFRGSDPRWDSRGVMTGIITPVPTGSTSGGGLDGFYEGYPIQFLNQHNSYVWRDRITGEPFVSHYSNSSAGLDIGPVRSDSSLIYLDGPYEPVPSASDIFSHTIEIETPWRPSRRRLFALPTTGYASLEAGTLGKLKVVWTDGADLSEFAVGDFVFFDEPAYLDQSRITEVGSDYILTDATFSTDTVLSVGNRNVWLKLFSLDVFEVGSTVSISVEASDLTSSGTQYIKVFDSSTSDEFDPTVTPLLSASLSALVEYEGDVPLSNTIIPLTQNKRNYTVAVRSGGFSSFVSLTQSAKEGVISNLNYGGSLCWQGGERDVLELMLLPSSFSSNYSSLSFNGDSIFSSSQVLPSGSSVNSIIEVDTFWVPDADDDTLTSTTSGSTRYVWMGGHYAGADEYIFDSTSRSGVAPLIVINSVALDTAFILVDENGDPIVDELGNRINIV